MKRCERLAFKAGNDLYTTIETLEELCSERTLSRMSNAKYRRLTEELRDMSRLLKTFIQHDHCDQRIPRIRTFRKQPADSL
ncbi:MAG: hypothetical protein LUE26_00655 [Alistipes sp.]|nr:hypothetical protein [Alistipes sp.]